MNGLERQYLRECIQALCNARIALLKLNSDEAVELIAQKKFGYMVVKVRPRRQIK